MVKDSALGLICLQNAPYREPVPISDPEACKEGFDSGQRCINTCTVPSHISPDGEITFCPDFSRKDYK